MGNLKEFVKIDDREEHKEIIRLMLNAVGFNIDYISVELILNILDDCSESSTIKDVLLIKKEWEKKWDDYSRDANDSEWVAHDVKKQ